MKNSSLFHEHIIIVGKGPSFIQQKKSVEKTIIALNTAALETDCDYIHIIDIDVYENIRGLLLDKEVGLIIPLYPHIDFKSTDKDVFDLLGNDDIFNELINEKRIILYNLENSNEFIEGYPTVSKSYFSAEVVVKLVCQFNIAEITLVGVDGGSQYSKHFDAATLLANGHQSFDIQFKGIQLATYKYKVELNHISFLNPIEVYVNCSFNNKIVFDIFYYSILCNSTVPFIIKIFYENPSLFTFSQKNDYKMIDSTIFRDLFYNSSVNDFKRKAIYFRSEMLVLDDLKNIFHSVSEEKALNIIKEKNKSKDSLNFIAVVFDYGKAIALIDSRLSKFYYKSLMLYGNIKKINDNSLLYKKMDNEVDEQAPKFIDYFNGSKPPWLFRGIDWKEKVWVSHLIGAIEDGFITKEDLKIEIIKGNVRPSLWFQVKYNVCNSKILSWKIKLLDKYFNSLGLVRKSFFYRLILNKVLN